MVELEESPRLVFMKRTIIYIQYLLLVNFTFFVKDLCLTFFRKKKKT
jgi:hypothetical protein